MRAVAREGMARAAHENQLLASQLLPRLQAATPDYEWDPTIPPFHSVSARSEEVRSNETDATSPTTIGTYSATRVTRGQGQQQSLQVPMAQVQHCPWRNSVSKMRIHRRSQVSSASKWSRAFRGTLCASRESTNWPANSKLMTRMHASTLLTHYNSSSYRQQLMAIFLLLP